MGSTSNKAEFGVLNPLESVICDGEPGVVFRTTQRNGEAANTFMSRRDMIDVTDRLKLDHLPYNHADKNIETITNAYKDLNGQLRSGIPLREISVDDIQSVSPLRSIMEPIMAKKGLSAVHASATSKPAYTAGTLEYIGPVEQLPDDYNNGSSMGKPGEMGAVFKSTEERGRNGEETTRNIFMSDKEMKKAFAQAPEGSINKNELGAALEGSAEANGFVVAMTAGEISKVKNGADLRNAQLQEDAIATGMTAKLALNNNF